MTHNMPSHTLIIKYIREFIRKYINNFFNKHSINLIKNDTHFRSGHFFLTHTRWILFLRSFFYSLWKVLCTSFSSLSKEKVTFKFTKWMYRLFSYLQINFIYIKKNQKISAEKSKNSQLNNGATFLIITNILIKDCEAN